MTRIPYRCSPTNTVIHDGLDALRVELEIPSTFPQVVLQEAKDSAATGPQIPRGSAATSISDRTDIPLVTVDPPGSLDLDQAVHAAKTSTGWRVHYAIADVAAWVRPGGAVDNESHARGLTMYSPDTRAALHPLALSEDAASLLPDRDRQALLWTIDVDDAGHPMNAHLERSLVRSRAKLSYQDAAALIDADESDSLRAVKEVGLRREALEIERGAVSLRLASQEVISTPTGFALEFDESLPIEGWNAQISLLTGIAGAKIMIDGGVGLLRTLPRPDDRTIRELRSTARALGIDWPKSMTYAEAVRSLDPNKASEAALIAQSARGLRGAGYEAFDGQLPEQTEHSAIAAEYAHVTAPLRRLGDRYANECILAILAGARPPEWVLETLPELPRLLGRARNREGSLERAVVDLVEAALLVDRVGHTFRGLVTSVDEDKNRVRVQISDPAVVAYADGRAQLGEEVDVRLDDVNVGRRRVDFTLVN